MYTVQLTHQAEHDVTRLAPLVATRILDRIEWLVIHTDETTYPKL